MRIVFISAMYGYPWGGSEVLWSQSALRLREAGHEVFASVTGWPKSPEPILRLLSAGVLVDERTWTWASFSRRIQAKLLHRPLKHPGWEPCWQRIIDFRPDLICLSDGGIDGCLEWAVRCRNALIPYVIVSQSNSEQWWPVDGPAEALSESYAMARKSYFVSQANLTLFERQTATRLPNGEVIRNPFNVTWDAAPAWPVEGEIFKLACVGRLDCAAKGQDILFEVLAMRKWRERPIHVSLFGDGPMKLGFKRLVEFLNIEQKVHFGGQVADIERIWSSHHALVLPSRYEGLPLAVVEAMLCGRLAIVTDVAGNKELVQDEVTGFIAAAPTVAALDEALERAWQRRADWQAMGQVAALSIRRQVPADPAKVFAGKLLVEAEKLK